MTPRPASAWAWFAGGRVIDCSGVPGAGGFLEVGLSDFKLGQAWGNQDELVTLSVG